MTDHYYFSRSYIFLPFTIPFPPKERKRERGCEETHWVMERTHARTVFSVRNELMYGYTYYCIDKKNEKKGLAGNQSIKPSMMGGLDLDAGVLFVLVVITTTIIIIVLLNLGYGITQV